MVAISPQEDAQRRSLINLRVTPRDRDLIDRAQRRLAKPLGVHDGGQSAGCRGCPAGPHRISSGRRTVRGFHGPTGCTSCTQRTAAQTVGHTRAMGQMTPELDPLRAPEPLNADHLIDGFSSGAPTLDGWLKRKARANQVTGASRTFVMCRGERVVGFYALAAGSVGHDLAPRKLRQNMPDPIPVIVSADWRLTPMNRETVLGARCCVMPCCGSRRRRMKSASRPSSSTP